MTDMLAQRIPWGAGRFCRAFIAAVCLMAGHAATAAVYELVIQGGRVIDPETGLDAVMNVGINGSSIQAVSAEHLDGQSVIDADGLVIAPGFIDLHVHSQTEEGYRLMVQDGVTSAFEIEVGTADVDEWYAQRSGGQYLNHGVGAGHIKARMIVMDDPAESLPTGPGAWEAATQAEIDEMISLLSEALERGAVAVGMGLEYTPAASDREVLQVMELAALHNASVHVHLDAGLEGLDRAIALAARAGGSLHVVHVNSAAKSLINQYLARIESARDAGLDVTTETYPYGAGMTRIESAKFSNWASWPDEEFGKFQWAETGEWLTRESFGARRSEGGIIIHHARTESMTRTAVTHPLTMIASDGFIESGTGHPRVSGSFSRVLGRYVREEGRLTLPAALAKMTIEPARRLEARVPAMRMKGRVQVGADADLTIFDPQAVIDRSTYDEPARTSAGIEYVIVGGRPVIRKGKLIEDARFGKGIRAPAPDATVGSPTPLELTQRN
ncbi:MAG: amidohydrolase family protein [Haliea sp.]|uniref:amidohydrolase family protein n=1 Tax=Marinobacter salarius TaxID=1420917 RepID=UPI0032EC7BC1